jgi:hypothetical protein
MVSLRKYRVSERRWEPREVGQQQGAGTPIDVD